MLKLKLTNLNHTGANAIVIEDVVRDIRQDENLTTNLESSSLLWKVTIPHDSPYIKDIVNEEDWEALLYDEDTDHVVTPFFTGYLSDSVSWAIDQHGQNNVQLTLEDKGVHLLKTPFTKTESKVISGKFSSNATGDLGVVQQICNKVGISCVSNIITDSTEVKCVAEAAETCESLLKSVCKEFCCAYSFNPLGELYLIPLSNTQIPTPEEEDEPGFVNPFPTVDDTSIYDSINLSKKTVSYKGSRVEWKELGTVNNTLVYRDISNQSTIHPNCYITLSGGGTYPSPDGAITYIQAVDLAHGAEVFSIDNLTPEIHWYDGSGASQIQTYGANSIAVLINATTSGHIDKLQATANLTYVKSKNVAYGDGQLATEALREETCRWVHTQTPAKKYANFLAQYDKYCSRSFTFKSKGTYELGSIIHLHENVHTGLTTYLMVIRRTRTLVDYNSTNKTFSGIWSYEAVSMSKFDYSLPVDTGSLWIPPSDTYVEVPDLPDVSSFTLSANKTFLTRDNHSSSTQNLEVSAFITGSVGTITLSASYNDGTVFPGTISVVTTNKWSITGIPVDTQYTSLNISGTDGTLSYTISVSFEDKTENIFFGAMASAPGQNVKKVQGDYYLNTTDGKTYEWSGSSWAECIDPNKLLDALYTARQNNIDFNEPQYQNANTVSWFNTIIAAKGIIDNLFSHEITLLDPGYIKSDNYTESGLEVICEADPSGVETLDTFAFDKTTFISHTWGYGNYRFVCTQGSRYSGTWDLYLESTRKDDDLSASNLSYYGITLSFDGEGYTAHTGDVIVVTYGEQAVPGQGFYLGSDGVFKCYDATMENTTSTNLIVNGDSYFHGTVDTEVFKTQIANPQEVPSGGIQGGASNQQAKNIIDVLVANDYPMNASHVSWTVFIPASLPDYPSAGVAYVSYWTNNSTYHLGFFDSSFTRIPVNQMGFTLAGQTGVNDYIWSGTSNGEYFTQNPVIKVYQGGSNVIWMDVPFAPTEGIASVPVKGVIAGAEANYGNYKYRPLWIRTL